MVRTTPESEIDRINERIFTQQIRVIDRDTFDLAFNNLFDKDDRQLSSKQKELRDFAFESFVGIKPDVSKKRLFRKERKFKEKRVEFKKEVTKRKRFNVPAISKGRVVLTQRIIIKIRGKEIERFRDELGRFASRKIK